MQQFEEIRRDHAREGLSKRELARRHGVHRRAVRQALESSVPPPKRSPTSRPAPKLGPYRALIDQWLKGDRDAPRKQRHTAKRIWERLRDEHAADVSERTVRAYVARKRRELGDPGQAFVPQVRDAGIEAEVDWGESQVVLAGRVVKVHIFHMRACHSGAAFAIAFLGETQQAFLEAHVEAFEWFGGTFALVRYDNLKAAVKKVLKGRRREESDRFVALRSHYLFKSQFTMPGIEGAHEKGGIEGEVGRFRRRHLVPVPEVETLAELNARLLAACERDLGRQIVGRTETVGESYKRERPLLSGLPQEPAQTAEEARPRVDQKSLVTVRQNRYSVPVSLVGLKVTARVGASEIAIRHQGKEVARHERLRGRFGHRACLDHYLDLLKHKPAAMAGSLALRQERERGSWPQSFDQLWAKIADRYDPSEAARQMVDVLMLCREHGPDQVELAAQGALAAGACDGRAVAVLARRSERVKATPIDGLSERLGDLASAEPTLADYDQLIGAPR